MSHNRWVTWGRQTRNPLWSTTMRADRCSRRVSESWLRARLGALLPPCSLFFLDVGTLPLLPSMAATSNRSMRTHSFWLVMRWRTSHYFPFPLVCCTPLLCCSFLRHRRLFALLLAAKNNRWPGCERSDETKTRNRFLLSGTLLQCLRRMRNENAARLMDYRCRGIDFYGFSLASCEESLVGCQF